MPEMSWLERAFCRSRPWEVFTRRLVLPWALQGVTLRGDILEIGGGSGAMAAGILRSFPEARLVVTDYDPAMVQTARSRLDRFSDRVMVQQADAARLAFDEASFDGVVSFIMLHHVLEWESALREVARVLHPGGVLVGYDLVASAPARWLHQVQRERQRMLTITEMRDALAKLPFAESAVRPDFGRLAMRFRATKAKSRRAGGGYGQVGFDCLAGSPR
jgi:ubiquinone/menaquinone biosynthesis C-methylase UbiE